MSAAPDQTEAAAAGKPKITEDQLGAAVVVGVHRLVKQSTLYTTENEAQKRQLELTQRAMLAYGRRTGKNARIFFTDNSVFVGGRLLRAGRAVYDAALELGRILKRFDVDEVAIGFDVPIEELRLFQQATAAAIRRQGPSPAQQHYTRIRLKRGHAPGTRPGDEDLSPQELLVRSYCTSIVVMRRFLEGIQNGKHELPVRVRRVAQQLADLAAIEAPAFLGTLALYNARHEHAGRAVNSAMIAIGMARQITDDGRLLARIAMASLLYDVGLARVTGADPTGEERLAMAMPRLGEEQYVELPAASAVVTTALGGLGEAALTHTVLVYESLWHSHRDRLGPAYGGLRSVTMEARVVSVARRFTELLADQEAELTADAAVCTLLREARDDADTTATRLLMSALGLFATGTLVELSNRQIAQVVRTNENPLYFSRPVVRPVLDASGGSLGAAAEIDLATQAGLKIARVVGTADDREVRAAEERRMSMRPPSPAFDYGGAFESEQDPGAAEEQADGYEDAGWDEPPVDDAWAPPPPPPQPVPEPPRARADSFLDQEFDEAFGGNTQDAQQDALAVMLEPDDDDFEQPPAPPPAPGPSRTPGSSRTPAPPPSARTPPAMATPTAQSQPVVYELPEDDGAEELHFDEDGYEESEIVDEATAPMSDALATTFEAATQRRPDGGTMVVGQPALPPDEDDVPSMVLQAIVDGRANEREDEGDRTGVYQGDPSDLHKLFFPNRELRATRPRPDRPADLSRPDSSRPGLDGPPPTPGRAPRSSPRAGQATPTDVHGPSMAALQHARASASREGTPVGTPAAPLAMPPQRLRDRPSEEAAAQARPAHRLSARTGQWLQQKLTSHKPSSQGNLQKTPLLHLLVYALDRRLTGTMMLVAEQVMTHFIYYEGGVPSKVRTSGDVAPLDKVLLEMGLLDEQTLAQSLRAVLSSQELHGRFLVKKGVLDVNAIRAALQWQLMRKLGHMLKLPPTARFAYYDGVNLLDDYGGPQLSPAEPLAIIMTGVRVLGQNPIVDQTLARLGGLPLRVRREADINRLHLREHERRIVDLLRARPMALPDLLSKQLAQTRVVQLTIYALLITRCLNLGASQNAPVGYGVPEVEQLWQPQGVPRTTGERSQPAAVQTPMAPLVGAPAIAASRAPGAPGQPSARPVRGTSSSRGMPTGETQSTIPRRGTSSTATHEPLPRRGTSSARGEVFPRRGTSSARGEPLPRRGTSSIQGQAMPSSPGMDNPLDYSMGGAGPASAPAGSMQPPLAPSRPSAPMRGEASRPSAPEPTPSPGPARGSGPVGGQPQGLPGHGPGVMGQPHRPQPQVRQGTPQTARAAAVPAGQRPAARQQPQQAPEEPPKGGLERDEITERARSITDQTYFQILEVEENCSPEAVQAAYFQLAKKWHPDRLHPALTDVKPQVAMIFARINEAYQTLSNLEKRREYTDLVKSGGGTARDREIVERVVDSALLFQKGEVLFRKGSYRQAESLVKQAVDADPDQPEYRALFAWIQAHRLGSPPDAESDRKHFYRDQIKMLDVVIKQEPEYERALFYRGQLLKRSGYEEQAMKDFKKVVELNPRNIDAAREVRLSSMRSKKEQKGIFGRLFSKDKG